MDTINKKGNINISINEGHIKLVGIMFLLFLLTSNKKSPSRFSLNLKEVDDIEIEKKCRLINRIKGYMNPEEQYVLHRAETILQIIGKVKLLLESPGLHSAEVKYPSLSLEDRKRNMLLDLSKHMEEEHRDLIHTAIDLDIKARTVEKKLRELNDLTKEGINLENIEKLIDLVEPIIEGEIKDKVKDLKKITTMFKLIKSVDEKGTLNENDLMEIIASYVEPQQRESLMKMMQIAKAVSSTMNNDDTKVAPTPQSNPLEIKNEKEDKEKKGEEVDKNEATKDFI
ncbi:hypothetical protein [Natronincola ferrireducens]|uniref:Uncharacterized protein n=1 Tax=Natronincola ferrireducens TaxID=393762 RepID=A0A1G9A478_9FIRM|nr:hypothetical protein [Natronincola ferrireducens]SDK22128.1 hypothetical protein SAMN05660472_01055 [Natronincola ferrireducens]